MFIVPFYNGFPTNSEAYFQVPVGCYFRFRIPYLSAASWIDDALNDTMSITNSTKLDQSLMRTKLPCTYEHEPYRMRKSR